ncbi:uncharacterized protein [Temnothorax nylanderi]|uniref:uncharacterized protein n=1 Tax=Temnothorax nylanderi TaxID=102681 RepID=UPI003A85DBA9
MNYSSRYETRLRKTLDELVPLRGSYFSSCFADLPYLFRVHSSDTKITTHSERLARKHVPMQQRDIVPRIMTAFATWKALRIMRKEDQDIKSIFNEDLIGVGRIPRTVSELHTDDANKDIRAVTWDELDGPESEARDEFVLEDAATTRAYTAKRA